MVKYCPFVDPIKTTVRELQYDEEGRLRRETIIEKEEMARCDLQDCPWYDGEACLQVREEIEL